jgi:hypothetical protein
MTETKLWGKSATLALAGLAGLSNLIYWLAYSRPFSLLKYYDHPLFDLRRYSAGAPNARWVLLAAFGIQIGLYLLGWRLARRARGRGAWGIVIAGSLVSASILLLMFPIGAADLFDYIMHGRIFSLYGANPFFDPGRQFANDPFFPYMGWRDWPSVYGPLWELIGGTAARLAGQGIIANVLVFKAFIGAFYFASILLVAATLQQTAPDYALAGVLLFAWNPIVLYETFGNGHNDIVMVFWILLAAWLLTEHHYSMAILALMAGGLIKYIPLLLVPVAGLLAFRDLERRRARLGFVAITGISAAALVAASYYPFWEGIKTLTVFKHQNLVTTSLPAVLTVWLGPVWGFARTDAFLSRAIMIATGAIVIWRSLCAWADRSQFSFARNVFWILLGYLLFTCPWFQEWYTVWPIAIAALVPSAPVLLLALALNLGGLTKHFVFGPLWLWVIPAPKQEWVELRLGPAVLALPWLALILYWLAIWRKPKAMRQPQARKDTSAKQL